MKIYEENFAKKLHYDFCIPSFHNIKVQETNGLIYISHICIGTANVETLYGFWVIYISSDFQNGAHKNGSVTVW